MDWGKLYNYNRSGDSYSSGTIIAACSVVTKDAKEYAIVGRNHASVIKFRDG